MQTEELPPDIFKNANNAPSPRRHKMNWLRALAPWSVSGLVHIALATIVLTSIYAGSKVISHLAETQKSIFIPSSFDNPGAAPDGTVTVTAGDTNASPLQQRLNQLLPQNVEPMQAGAGKSLSAALAAGDTDSKPYAIGLGTGGKAPGSGGASDGGSLFGVAGGTGTGPRATFFGATGNAMKIVYIIDRTGSLVDSWRTGVQAEVKKSVNKLVAAQAFAVITFTSADYGGAKIVGNWTAMRYASRENKAAFMSEFDPLPSAGGDADQFDIFKNAFEMAFSLRPQQIFFLTDGEFDPKLLSVISELNRDKSVKISTIAFTVSTKSMSPTARAIRARMQLMASQNGGAYKEIGAE